MTQISSTSRDVSLLKKLRQTIGEMVDLVVPNVCCNCRLAKTEQGPICKKCIKELLYVVTLPYCPRCGATLGPNLVSNISQGCYECPTPMPRFASVYRLGAYEGLLRETIKQIKYNYRWPLIKPLAKLLAERIGTNARKFDMIVPVPMFWTRRLTRGCNHSTLLAKHLASNLNLPMFRLVRRTKNTAMQTMHSKTRRLKNVKGAFKIAAKPDGLSGMKILLVDDVTTTGATANEAARMLKIYGAEQVELAVLAKSCRTINYEETK